MKDDLRNAATHNKELSEAMNIACGNTSKSVRQLVKTDEKNLTRRGVIWLGQTCNLKCQFCYFIDRVEDRNHPEHGFMPLIKAKKICRTLVDHYENKSIDIQGGEPTLYPEICDLVTYCKDIGLTPTLITNALLLDKLELCKKLQHAGVSDFLVSVQGLGDVHDTLVGCPGAHRRQMKALCNLQELGIPFRFNVVMSKPALPQLPAIAELAIKAGALVVNFITFNPFADQALVGKRNDNNVPRYSDVRPYLTAALDLLDAAGVEANVRYFPFCMVEERHRKSIYNFQQLSYDPHEWDFSSWAWTGLTSQRQQAGSLSPPILPSTSRLVYRYKRVIKRLATIPAISSVLHHLYGIIFSKKSEEQDRDKLYRKIATLHAQVHCGYIYGSECGECDLGQICDGIHGDYARLFGTQEAKPVTSGAKICNPHYFISNQEKISVIRHEFEG